jgi:predicted DNA-binding transcriptional regulator AlpA
MSTPKHKRVRLIERPEVLDKVPLTYASIWQKMRDGTFPRSRAIGGRSVWVEDEIDAWIAALPVRRLKGDADTSNSLPFHRALRGDDKGDAT